MKRYLTVLFYFTFTFNSIQSHDSMQIKNLNITRCDSKIYPVFINNVTLHLDTKSRVKISGSLSSEVNLIGPLKAVVSLKRDIWGLWVPVPCEHKLGSCTYEDLCDYGYPKNTTCPQVFIKNKVPCRCPIKKGNYTIPPTPTIDFSKETSIISGTYWAKVMVTQNDILLSCYDFSFILYDENESISVFKL